MIMKNHNSDTVEERSKSFDSRILSSSHINFLFGSGVNGDAFPQMSGFKETINILESFLGRASSSFEVDIDELTQKKQKEKVLSEFVKEFNKFSESIDYSQQAILDIESMFHQTNRLVLESENRTITTKQVNIYTLNYDDIVENVLIKMGFLTNIVSSNNIDEHDKFFDLVGYNYNVKKYIPTYLVSKIHGEIQNPILPGKSKYDDTLESKRFEILFRMKSQLSRVNATLLVIGYSGNDKHINRLLKDCIASGLTIYWLRFSDKELIPTELAEKILIIDQPNNENKVNMTRVCASLLGEIWER